MLNFGDSRVTEIVQAWASEEDEYAHPPDSSSCPPGAHEHVVVRWQNYDQDHDWSLMFYRRSSESEWSVDQEGSLQLMAQQSADRIGRQLSKLAGERIRPTVHAHFAEPTTEEDSQLTTGQYL